MNADPQVPASRAGGGGRRKILSIVAGVLILAGILWFIDWFLVLSERETTEDAYVSGNKVVVSSQVAGTVVAIGADDTQRVQAGQTLVKLDSTDADSALERAASALAQAVRQVRQQTLMADQYDAQAASRRLELARARSDLAHREPLAGQQAIAPEEIRHARESVELAKAALAQALRQAQAARALTLGTQTADNPAVLEARAAYVQAWVDTQRNAILAPVAGFVAERSVQLGQRIAPGEALMAVVPLSGLWVDANFKEVQLRHIRIGQPASIVADLYGGGVRFHGRVAGVGAGTGAAFALLPAQNASGNWIKVVQRIPVRIELDPKDLEAHPLRIGLSTTVDVDTHDRSGAVLTSAAGGVPLAGTSVFADLREAGAASADAIIARNLRLSP